MFRYDCKYIHRPMVRPELNKGKPFEAMSLRTEKTWYSPKSKQMLITVLAHEHFLKIVEEDFTHTYAFNDEHKLDEFMSILSYEKAQALNPPIKVTQEVLDAMEKAGGAYSAKSILVDTPDYSYNLHFDEKKKVFTFRGGMTFDVNEQDVPIYTIQADCPLALQVLLGFTTEGVPVND